MVKNSVDILNPAENLVAEMIAYHSKENASA